MSITGPSAADDVADNVLAGAPGVGGVALDAEGGDVIVVDFVKQQEVVELTLETKRASGVLLVAFDQDGGELFRDMVEINLLIYFEFQTSC